MKLLWILTIIATIVSADDSNSTTSSTSSSSSSSSSSSKKASGTNLFVDSASTYYDGYQQAWRYLGWYVKCGSPSDRYSSQQHHSHSGDSSASEESVNHYCQRYLIWASYIDENYKGGGIGEYSYYNSTTQTWDQSACKAHGNGRCAPMDCHETNTTTWKLMGVFKEASYFGNDAFFEQLFKHEGICVWNNANLYSFMQTARKNYWPNGCISTGIQIKNSYSSSYGKYLYLDLRPTWNGNMTYGLYSDDICKNEYDLPDMNVDTITKNLGLLYGSGLQTWNNGLEAFKVCQPCKAYNLKNSYASSNYYGSYSDSSDPNDGYFQCYDDADYTNVNQCMKFRSHAQLEVCTWEDLVTATNQGGILQVKVGDTIFGSERMTKEEYQSLMKSQKESNLKWSKAEAQTVAMYRAEAEKVEALKPTADSWSSLGSTSIAIGAVAILGAVLWVTKRHIDRMFPSKALSEPLLPPSRDFLGKKLASNGGDSDNNQNGALQTAVPFGNDTDDDDSAIRKAGTIDDNTSVSSLSYVSTSPDPAIPENSAIDTDAIAAWYKSVKKIESHESWAESVVKDVEDENKSVKVIPLTTESTAEVEQQLLAAANTSSNDIIDDASDVFDGIDPSLDVPNADTAILETETPDLEEAIVQADAPGLEEIIVQVDTPEPEEAIILADAPEPEEAIIQADAPEPEEETIQADAPEPEDAIIQADATEPEEAIVEADATMPVAVDSLPNEIDDVSTKSIPFLGDVSVTTADHVSEVEGQESKGNCDEEAVSEAVVAISTQHKVTTAEHPINDDDVDVHSQEETARMSNVSLDVIDQPEPEMTVEQYPDEMMQYLSMSASEGEDIGTEPDDETDVLSQEIPSNREETARSEVQSMAPEDAHDGSVDDK